MAQHKLSLEIPDIRNTCILRVVDTSLYSPLVPIECPKLEITPPGFWQASLELPSPGFTENLTACDLKIQTTNCDNYNNILVDGVYIIKYSVSPNDTVFVEYNYLRITNALNKYYELLCCLDIKGCDPTIEIQEKIKQAQLIKTLFDAAKARVEYCHHPIEGMSIYNHSLKLLNKLLCQCGCGC